MQIMQTQDYNLFKRLPGNRQKQQPHVRRLIESINKDSDLVKYQPILVNDQMEVIDGQHRLEALEKLSLPVPYIKANNLNLRDVQTLNTLSRTWQAMDYAKSFVELGNQNYQHYIDAKLKYHLPHEVTLVYLNLKEWVRGGEFNLGQFKVGDLNKSYDALDKLTEVGQYYPRYKHRPFGLAYKTLVTDSRYDHDRMIAKLKRRAHTIGDFSLKEDYERALEAVYNYNTNINNRVRFF